MAGDKIIGKTGHELIWTNNADTLQVVDKKVFETGKTNLYTGMCR
jgi:hypothetical protein